jgi:hypothetical protein
MADFFFSKGLNLVNAIMLPSGENWGSPSKSSPFTGSPVPVAGCEEKDSIAKVLRFLDVEAIVRLKCPEPVGKPLSNGVSAIECSAFKKSVRDEHHVLGVMAHCTREVPLVRSCEQVAHNLDVLAYSASPAASRASARFR